jgi:surface carbohydrate biosynthesis protein (TIGR04326 family)
MCKRITIIDQNLGNFNFNDSKVLLWNQNAENVGDVISLPKYVDDNALVYRTKFLNWLSEFAKTSVHSTTLEEYYRFQRGLSYFWMSNLGQKCNALDSSRINTAIKLFALEDIINIYEIQEVVLISKDSDLVRTLVDFCGLKRIKFVKHGNLFKYRFKFNLNFIPKIFLSIVYFIYFIVIRKLRFKIPDSKLNESSIIFFDIFINVSLKGVSTNPFNSHYWSKLPEFIQKLNIPVTWAHLFFREKSTPNSRIAENKLLGLNQISDTQEHTILDSYMTIDVITKAWAKYLNIYVKTIFLQNKKRLFRNTNLTSFDFYYIFKEEFFGSLYGIEALRSCLYYFILDKYLSSVSNKKVGFYIQENQPWELMLVCLWKKYNHGNLVGVPHTTVRFWDLRYFFDFGFFKNAVHLYPVPDYFAVNGLVAKNFFIDSGYPPNKIKEVEALRYLYLKPNIVSKKERSGNINLLMCGDFLPSTNIKMILILVELFQMNNLNLNISVKAHPATVIPKNLFGDITIVYTTEPLSTLVKKFDFVFTSNISSAAVDVYFTNVALIQHLDGEYFNMSPLKGLNDVHFISSSKEMLAILNNELIKSRLDIGDYFYLNDELIKWKAILNSFD